MICVSIAQESRRFALVDLLNAGKQADLLEVRLDRFGKAPDLGEFLAHKTKPLIFSCRRTVDGGGWDQSEDERQSILRQCIAGKADYVELELDIADKIRPFPPAKRIISYTNLHETPANIGEIYTAAQTKSPDVIKLATNVRTPEEAWPLLQILAKPALPTVVVGLGKPGLMLDVLGRKIGAPWVYAALEKGMEAYPGQPTVADLREVYHYGSISRSTRLVAVTGLGEREYASVAALNAGFVHLGINTRCLPLAVGSVPLFRKIMDAIHLSGVVIDYENQGRMAGIAGQLDSQAQAARAVDLLCPQEKSWLGYFLAGEAAARALEETLATKIQPPKPIEGRVVLIAGTNSHAAALARALRPRGVILIIAGHNRAAAQALAQACECRFIQWEALYSTMHDVLAVCDAGNDGEQPGSAGAEGGLHMGYLRPGMTVMHLGTNLRASALLSEARARSCAIVSPALLMQKQLESTFHLLTGRQVPNSLLANTLKTYCDED